MVFPEGFTRAQMADRVAVVAKIAARKAKGQPKLAKRTYLAATSKPRVPACFPTKAQRIEGFLFPATYEFFRQTTSASWCRSSSTRFVRTGSRSTSSYARSKHLTPYDVLIIASMVEKETVVAGRAAARGGRDLQPAAVGMPLGIDATIRYGLDVPPTSRSRESQLASTYPYNTRKFQGLPPTPIASPGLASMQAAAHPAKVDYLYFVRKPDKKHHFFTASSGVPGLRDAHGYGP